MSPATSALALATALVSAAAGGVLLGFSAFVMHGLGRLPATEAIAAMRAINASAVRPPFLIVLFGTAAGCAALAVHAARHPGQRPAGLLAVGSALYLIGVVGVTVGRNVPLNDALAGLTVDSAGSAAAWETYARAWTRWNHVRAASGLAAAAAFATAAR